MSSMGGKSSSSAARAALSGMLIALNVVVLFLGYTTGVMDLTALAVTSMFTAVAMVELGGAYPYMIWVASGVICFIILPDKFLASEYLLFGGIYPVLKLYFERLSRIAEWVVKLGYSTLVLGVLYLLSRFVFGLPQETDLITAILAVSYAVFFVVYDFALTSAITLYMRKLRPKLTFLRRLR